MSQVYNINEKQQLNSFSFRKGESQPSSHQMAASSNVGHVVLSPAEQEMKMRWEHMQRRQRSKLAKTKASAG